MTGGRRVVGRDVQLAALDVALDDLSAGRGGAVFIAGEAGIGKTRLAQEAADRARGRGASVAWATSWGESGAPPLWTWEAVARQLGVPLDIGWRPDHPTSADAADAARFEQLEAVAESLRAASTSAPVVVVLDDLQWAGPASLRVLAFVVGSLRDRPCLIVGTYRAVELDSESLELLARLGPTLALGGLDRTAVAEVLALAVGHDVPPAVADAVGERAGGNPLFVSELGRLMAASGRVDIAPAAVPPAVGAVLQRRLARVSEGAVAHLQAAAVLGKQFTTPVLSELTGELGDSELKEAAACGLVERGDSPTEWTFAHDLVRDVVLDATAPERRAVLHGAAAAALTRRAETDGSLHVAIARHLERTGPDRAVEAAWHWEQAAQWATGVLAYEEAATALARSRALLPSADPERTAELLLEEAQSWLRAGELAAARRIFHDAATSARRAARPDLLAAAALGIGAGVMGWEVPIADDDYVALLDEALACIDPEDRALRSMLLARLSVAAATPDTLDTTRARAFEALDLAGQAGDATTLVHALAAVCDAHAGPEHAEQRRAHAEAILGAAAEAREPGLALLGRRFLVVALLELGRFAELDREIARFEHDAKALRQPLVAWYAPLFRGMRVLLRGDVETAQQALSEVRAAAETTRSKNAELMAATLAMGIAAVTGRAPEVELEHLVEVDPALWPSYAAGLGYHALLGGDLARAAAMLALHADTDFSQGIDSEHLTTLVTFSRIALAVDDGTAIERLHDFLLPHAAMWAVDGIAGCCWGPVDLELARLAAALGRRDEAAAHLARAGEAVVEAGARLHELEAANLAAALGAGAPARQLRVTPEAAFRREGDLWALTWDDRTVRLRDAKGLADISRLLSAPGAEISAIDLYGGMADAGGEVLDERARSEYRRRIVDLEEELAEADDTHDAARSERAAAERDVLLAELSAALGLGGRPRRFATGSERARKAVSTRVHLAIDRIDAVHPSLARHLRNSIRTGAFCSYHPEMAVVWRR